MTQIPQTTLGERLLAAATATLKLFSVYLGDPAEVVRRAVRAVPDDGSLTVDDPARGVSRECRTGGESDRVVPSDSPRCGSDSRLTVKPGT